MELWDNFFTHPIVILASRPADGKTPIFLNFLYNASILKQQKVTLFSISDPISWYERQLISLLSGIDMKVIHMYFDPCSILGHRRENRIDRNRLINAIEQMQDSAIYMCDLGNRILSMDIVDYILEYEEESRSHFFVINQLKDLIQNSKYSLDQILQKFQIYEKKYHTKFLLIDDVDSKAEGKKDKKISDIVHYDVSKKYVGCFLLVYRCYKDSSCLNQLKLLCETDRDYQEYRCFYDAINYQIFKVISSLREENQPAGLRSNYFIMKKEKRKNEK